MTLAQILHRLATLEAAVDRVRVLLEARPVRRPVDSAADGALLSAIALRFGSSEIFTAAALSTSSDAELRAIVGTLRRRQIGAWLRRLHRHPVPPYTLRRVQRDARGALWVLAVSHD